MTFRMILLLLPDIVAGIVSRPARSINKEKIAFNFFSVLLPFDSVCVCLLILVLVHLGSGQSGCHCWGSPLTTRRSVFNSHISHES